MAEDAWGTIRSQTRIVNTTLFCMYFICSKISRNLGTCLKKYNSNYEDKVFKEFFHDINEAIDYSKIIVYIYISKSLFLTYSLLYRLDSIIDWTVAAAVEMAEEKLSTSNFYDLTFECKSLVDRLTNEEKSVSGLRRELLTEHEFQEKLFDDSVKDKDWAYVRFISDYL